MSGSYAGYHGITKQDARRALKNKYSEEKHNEKRIQGKKKSMNVTEKGEK